MLQRFFSGKDTKFIPLFERQADLVRQSGEELLAMMQTGHEGLRREKQKNIAQLEHDGDNCVREILKRLYKTFFAPYDHEDVKSLARRLDDILDEIDFVASQMMLYKFGEADASMLRLSLVTRDGTETVASLVRDMKNVEQSRLHFDRLDQIEEEGDKALSEALHLLFANSNDPLTILKYKELYERLEKATDHCKDVSDIVEEIVLKYS